MDDNVYVLDKYEQLIAEFNKDDEDTLINPHISETQNAEAKFTCSIKADSPKWQEIKNPENLFWCRGKVFSINFDGCITETISENDEKLISITGYERQKLLTRKYVKAWNSDEEVDTITDFMVVILSNGKLPLKNGNNEEVNSLHLKGTSGYALDGLLYGTGWSTGDCDVEGVFDLETEQVSVYENILKVQELWGGILVFDSANKKVHHRNEVLWTPHNGYEVKYTKNMKSLEKEYNNKIITKLCPLGESGLNIADVNNGSIWLEDYSTYTDSVFEGIENNPDITDPEQLKRWGQRKLKDLCKPQKNLTVDVALLNQLKGHELETVELNDIVDVINYDDIEGTNQQLRIVKFDYDIWDNSTAIIELSDITLDSTDIFKKNVQATTLINNGTLNSNKVIVFSQPGKTIDDVVNDVNIAFQGYKQERIIEDGKIGDKLTQIDGKIDGFTGEVKEYKEQMALFEETLKGLQETVSTRGGSNLIRNSVGYFGNEYWEGWIVTENSTDVKEHNTAESAIRLQNGNIKQILNNIKNGIYNISFNYKKLKSLAQIKVKINEGNAIELTEQYWKDFSQVLEIRSNRFSIEFGGNDADCCLISDLILIEGQAKPTWSQNANETTTEFVSIGKGIQVESSITNTYTRIDADGNRTYNKTTGAVVNEATDKGTVTEELTVRGQAKVNDLLIEKIDNQVWLIGMGG